MESPCCSDDPGLGAPSPEFSDLPDKPNSSAVPNELCTDRPADISLPPTSGLPAVKDRTPHPAQWESVPESTPPDCPSLLPFSTPPQLPACSSPSLRLFF